MEDGKARVGCSAYRENAHSAVSGGSNVRRNGPATGISTVRRQLPVLAGGFSAYSST